MQRKVREGFSLELKEIVRIMVPDEEKDEEAPMGGDVKMRG